MSPLRIALTLPAIALCAWFALGARQAHDQARAVTLLSGAGSVSASSAAQARRALDHAGTLNPDRAVDLLRARLAERTGDPRAAQDILQRVVAEEPQYIDAWLLLELNTFRRDAALNRLAGQRIRELAPPAPPAP